MSNLSDKEIDRLSREAADSFEPDPGSLSWSRLEQMLTTQMPERPPDGFRFGRINPYIWGPAVVLIAGISFYLIKSKFYSRDSTLTNQSSSKLITTPSVTEKKKPELNKIRNDSAHAIGLAGDSKNQIPVSVSSGDLSAKAKPAGDLNMPHSGDSRQSQNVTATANRGSGKNTVPHRSDRGNNIIYGLTGAAASTGNAIKDVQGQNNLAVEGSGSTSISVAKDARIPASLPPLAVSRFSLEKVKGNDDMLNRNNATAPALPQRTMHINRSLNIGFGFGPDYTSAGGIANNQLSNNIGFTVGYYLTGKLSVNTGIFYSNKFFWSPGYGPGIPQQSSYPPGTTQFAAPTIECINGSANLYEVPLTLRYDFAHSDHSKFFVNAGLSSYFIINQSYIYFSHTGNRAAAWKRTDNSQQNYWFGMSNFSFGMETEMGKGFSFQAEPYIKIPLKPMGLENAKLNSYGILLSFRYTPVLGRSKK